MVCPSETGNSQLIYNCLKNGTFQTKFDKIDFFNQHSQPLYDVMRNKINNLEFLQSLNFEFMDSLKNNGTKYLLIFDEGAEEILKSKAFVNFASAGKHCSLSFSY